MLVNFSHYTLAGGTMVIFNFAINSRYTFVST